MQTGPITPAEFGDARAQIEARLGRPLGPVADMSRDNRDALAGLIRALRATKDARERATRAMLARVHAIAA